MLKKNYLKGMAIVFVSLALTVGCTVNSGMKAAISESPSGLELFISQNSPVVQESTRAPGDTIKAYYMNNYSANTWNPLSDLYNYGQIVDLDGDNRTGVIVSAGPDGKTMFINPNFNVNSWYSITPPSFTVQGIAGENRYGAIAFGGSDKRQAAYMNYYPSGVWHTLPRAPWPIMAIAGDNLSGVLIYGGYQNREFAYINNYNASSWTVHRSKAPFEIKGIDGDNRTGIVAFGGPDNKNVAYMNNYDIGHWVDLGEAPIRISHIAGENRAGIAIVGGYNNSEVYICTNYALKTWVKLRDIPDMQVARVAGDNLNGLIVNGKNKN